MAVNYTTNGPVGTVAGFSHRNNNTDANVTGGANVHTLVYDTEIFDTGGVMDGTTFTAPITGKYLMIVNWSLDDLDAGSHTYIDGTIYTSNRNYHKYDFNKNLTGGIQNQHIGVIADMDASDTAVVTINQVAGVQQMNISANSTFSGFLVC